MKFSEILNKLLIHKQSIIAAAESLHFTDVRIINEGDGNLHLLVDEKRGEKLAGFNRQLNLRAILEDLLRCHIRVKVVKEIREELRKDYIEGSVSLKDDQEEVLGFFGDERHFPEIRALEDDSEDEGDVFDKDRTSYFQEEMASIAEAESWSPLLIATYLGELEKVKEILSHDSSAIKKQDRFGNNILLLAAMRGKISIFDWVVSLKVKGSDQKSYNSKVNLDVRNNEGLTPFLAAVHRNQPDFIKYLIETYPSNIATFFTTKDGLGRDACDIAASCYYTDLYYFLLSLKKTLSVASSLKSSSFPKLSSLLFSTSEASATLHAAKLPTPSEQLIVCKKNRGTS